MPISVKMLPSSSVKPQDLISHAALMCYQKETPVLGEKTIDVKKRLFDVGHHTTLQHSFFTFCIENIAVGDITFGLHMSSPFYNSDQRSGRYSKMFDDPNMDEIGLYIEDLWPAVQRADIEKVIAYVRKGTEIYQENIASATDKAKELLAAERPFASAKYIDATAPKVAQEQLRNFIPVIFPTALDYTVNLSALAAMWYSAFTPALRVVTDKMVAEVLTAHPELSFMFNVERRWTSDWTVPFLPIDASYRKVKFAPSAYLVRTVGDMPEIPESELLHPVDLLHFSPEFMDNSVREIVSEVSLSVATMGQDQRHRTIRRGQPRFTRSFYLPPVADGIGLEDVACQYMDAWMGLCSIVPPTLHTVLAPYGAMVHYKKHGDINAIIHEQAKRLCFCAQEEISNLSRQLREQVGARDPEMSCLFEPPCFKTGKCAEGSRYCGRDLSLRETGNYFPVRKV